MDPPQDNVPVVPNSLLPPPFVQRDMSHLTPWAHEPDAELVGTGERLTFPGGSYYSAGTYLGNEVPALGNEVPALGNEVPVRKVQDLRPGMHNFTITLKVLDVKVIHKRPWILETMVGDETAVIVLKTTGRMNKRIRSFEGKMIKLKNAKIELYKNSMRLMVNSEGDIEPSQAAEFIVKQDNNVSLLEWERVDVVI